MDQTKERSESPSAGQEADPRLGILINQQRRRAELALSRSRLILGALVVTILAGLAAYVIFPFIREYLDGRRLTLLDSRAAALTVSADLDGQREALRADLIQRLRWVAHEVEAGWIEPSSFAQVVPLGEGRVLIHAIWHVDLPRTRLFTYDMATGRGAPLQGVWSDQEGNGITVLVEMIPLSDRTVLLLGSDGAMRHYDPQSGRSSRVEPTAGRYTVLRDAVAMGPSEMLVVGSNGALLIYTHNGQANGYLAPIEAETDGDTGFTSAVRLGEAEVFLTAEDAELYILASDWQGHQIQRVDTSALAFDGDFVTATPLPNERVLIYGRLRNAAWGAASWRVFLLDRASGALTELQGTAPTGDRMLRPGAPEGLMEPVGDVQGGARASTQGMLMRYEIEGETYSVWLPEAAAEESYAAEFSGFARPVLLSEGARPLIVLPGHSDAGAPLLSLDPSSGETGPMAGAWPDAAHYGFALGAADGTRILLGEWGWHYDQQVNIARFDPTVQTVVPVTGGWSEAISELQAAVAVDDRSFLLFGRDAIVALTDGFATRLEGEAPVADAATMARRAAMISPVIRSAAPVEAMLAALARDIGLQDFVNNLPDDIRTTDDMITLAAALSDVIGQRIAVLGRLTTSEQDLLDIPTGLFGLNQQQMAFRDFMAICRGQGALEGPSAPARTSGADAPGTVTLACAEAWQAQLDGQQSNWWQAIATQVPPAILLLFLLATLGGLYRYNMQLSGFYHSRADALELLSMNRSKDDIEKLGRIAESLAADRIEFKAQDIPSAQAASVLSSLLSRGR